MGRRELLITVTVAGEFLVHVCLKYHASFRETGSHLADHFTVEFKTSKDCRQVLVLDL